MLELIKKVSTSPVFLGWIVIPAIAIIATPSSPGNYALLVGFSMFALLIAAWAMVFLAGYREQPDLFDKPSRRIKVRLYEDEITELTKLGYGNAAQGVRKTLNRLP